MTVAIGAICGGDRPTAILLADHQRTWDGGHSEPSISKVWKIGRRIVAVAAGTDSISSEVMHEMCTNIGNLEDHNRTIRIAAELAWDSYTSVKLRAVLGEFCVTTDEWRNGSVPQSRQSEISKRLQEYHLDFSALFVGIDNDGEQGKQQKVFYAHLYAVDWEGVHCMDQTSFYCIGSGQYAVAYRMAKYSHDQNKPVHETVFMAYSAKRYSEIDPMVGPQTTIFTIDIDNGLSSYPKSEFEKLEAVYEKWLDRGKEADVAAFSDMLNM